MRKIPIKKTYIYWGIAIVITIVVAIISLLGNGNDEKTIVVHPDDFISTVSVSGKVVAEESANLGFNQSGRVAGINARVGDVVKAGTVLAFVDSTDLLASIGVKKANLDKERAKLASLIAGTKPEQISLYESKLTDAGVALLAATKSAYLQVENAIKNKADTLFTNGDSVNPTINVDTQSVNEKKKIESSRVLLRESMEKWKIAITNATADPESIKNIHSLSGLYLTDSKNFYDFLGSITGNLSVSGSGLSQAAIDTYRMTINAGAQEVADAIIAEQSAYTTWNQAKETLSLEKSGSTKDDVDAQNAAIKAAEADLNSARAQYSMNMVVAPFDGIVTKMDVKVGEIVSPSISEIAMMSNGVFRIESYVPEVNIASIKIGDHAKITLDAYAEDITFTATVISIDPAETVRDGVSTYKVKLLFDTNDQRIKSGMTANVLITTAMRSGVIIVPQGIISSRDGQKFVTVKRDGNYQDITVTTGDVSSLGEIEITSGLNDGDSVILKIGK